MNGKRINKKSGNGSAPQGYAVTALVLQGGGALGSYQAGVYEGLAEADIHPSWVAVAQSGAPSEQAASLTAIPTKMR